MNPASIIKIMGMKSRFDKNHPKFGAFIRMLFSRPMEEGTILEIKVTRPGEEPVTANIRIVQDDIELLHELAAMREQ